MFVTEYKRFPPRNVSKEINVPTYAVKVKAVLLGRGQYIGV